MSLELLESRDCPSSIQFVGQSFAPYDAGYLGTIERAYLDWNADGTLDLAVVPTVGPAHVKVYSGTDLSALASFFAFDPAFSGGASIAGSGGILAVGAGPGGGPHVRTFNSSGQLASFFAYAPEFSGGVNVWLDGSDILTGPRSGGGPHVKVFDSVGGVRSLLGRDEGGYVSQAQLQQLATPPAPTLVAAAPTHTAASLPHGTNPMVDLINPPYSSTALQKLAADWALLPSRFVDWYLDQGFKVGIVHRSVLEHPRMLSFASFGLGNTGGAAIEGLAVVPIELFDGPLSLVHEMAHVADFALGWSVSATWQAFHSRLYGAVTTPRESFAIEFSRWVHGHTDVNTSAYFYQSVMALL